jgi:dimethylhistidine N-methyltransferase
MTSAARTLPKTAQTNRIDAALAADVLEGLRATPKRLPAKCFYDAEGLRLFEEITAQPEYYLTRTEIGILQEQAGEIAAMIKPGAALVEFGSGSAVKIRILLKALAHTSLIYVPVDICGCVMEAEAEALRREFPGLAVVPVVADFSRPFDLPAPAREAPARAGFFPGSTIGNLEPHHVAAFFRDAGRLLGRDAVLIVGVDLVKPVDILNAAYNDAAGVTARFNLNVLARLNRELGANFDLTQFEHHAFYNRERNRIEMHLASLRRQKVRICGETFEFRVGETIHTENSYKYSVESFAALARGNGWSPVAVWKDRDELFSVHALAFKGSDPVR